MNLFRDSFLRITPLKIDFMVKCFKVNYNKSFKILISDKNKVVNFFTVNFIYTFNEIHLIFGPLIFCNIFVLYCSYSQTKAKQLIPKRKTENPKKYLANF